MRGKEKKEKEMSILKKYPNAKLIYLPYSSFLF